MMYILSLIIFMTDGTQQSFELSKSYSAEACVDQRDSVRGSVSYYNDLLEKRQLSVDKSIGHDVEFIDSECNATSLVF